MKNIFVFGSNLQGIHGAGAAKVARFEWGAQLKVGKGRTGNAYAIPTKSTPYQSLELSEIEKYVTEFIDYSHQHPKLHFIVTRIGCGLAGFKDYQIAPMFKGCPSNVELPLGWKEYL